MTMITPSYLGETIEYSSLHACRSTLEDPTFDEVMERLSHRQGHFMKPSMLQSQSDILEEPGDDEIHVNVHIGQADPEHEAMAVAGALGL